MKFLIFTLLFFVPFLANGAVVINEIMYDLPRDSGADKGREWIEVFNSGDEAVSLSGWKLFENKTNHKIKPIGENGGFAIPPGGYAVIADKPEKFFADWPNFSGLVFDSYFSLKNSGEELVLKDAELNSVDSVVYSSGWGGKGDGNSLQWNGGRWITAPPTPGARNFSAVSAEAKTGVVSDEKIAPSPVEPKPKATTAKTEKKKEKPIPSPANLSEKASPGAEGGVRGEKKESFDMENSGGVTTGVAGRTEELEKTVALLREEVARLKKASEESRARRISENGSENNSPHLAADPPSGASEARTPPSAIQTANALSGISQNRSRSAPDDSANPGVGGWLLAVLGIGVFGGAGAVIIRRQGFV